MMMHSRIINMKIQNTFEDQSIKFSLNFIHTKIKGINYNKIIFIFLNLHTIWWSHISEESDDSSFFPSGHSELHRYRFMQSIVYIYIYISSGCVTLKELVLISSYCWSFDNTVGCWTYRIYWSILNYFTFLHGTWVLH